MFKLRDLYDAECVKLVKKTVKGDLVYSIYVWKPMFILADIFDVTFDFKPVTTCTCYTDACDLKRHIFSEVRKVFDKYVKWLEYKNNFAQGKLDAIIPDLTEDEAAFWIMFNEALYLNTFTKLWVFLCDIRNYCDTVSGFDGSVNRLLIEYLHKKFIRYNTDDMIMHTLEESPFINTQTFGKMYWWIEPYAVKERRIKRLKSEIHKGIYDYSISGIEE